MIRFLLPHFPTPITGGAATCIAKNGFISLEFSTSGIIMCCLAGDTVARLCVFLVHVYSSPPLGYRNLVFCVFAPGTGLDTQEVPGKC